MNDTGVIQAAMDQAVRDGVFPGGVLAGRCDGEIGILVVAGRVSSEPGGEAVQASTIYDLASLTKPLATVTSILLLMQTGKLELETTVGEILVELNGTPIGSAPLRDLLSHRSGLPGWRPLYERLDAEGLAWGRGEPAAVRQAVLRLIRDEPLLFRIGERSLYSDLGFILLGCAVERVSGLLLDEYFRQAVVQPLGANPLFFNRAATAGSQSHSDRVHAAIAPTEWDDRRARLLRGDVHDENAAAMAGVAGHAGLFGTVQSVLAVSGAWLAAYHGERSLLEGGLVREFTKQQSPAQSSWALGWDTPSAPSSSGIHFSPASFGHLGFTGTSLWIDPRRKVEMVLLTNRVYPSRTNDLIRGFRPVIHNLAYRVLTQA
ncbi:MAG TPA: serine hydrolase [Nitrospira sp.]|nr:serine hydrolase [Nitrospira sp.]